MAGSSVFTPCLEAIPNVKNRDGEILTKPFLEVCKLVLPVIDKFGSVMAPVKSDIGGNISRLEAKYLEDPSTNAVLYNIVRKEVASKGSLYYTTGLLWLTRAMDFIVELFRNLLEHPDWAMSQACTDSYNKTLKKWHGWLAGTSFKVGMKFAPNRKRFMEVIGANGDVMADIEKFCSQFPALLAENHQFLRSVGMDELRA